MVEVRRGSACSLCTSECGARCIESTGKRSLARSEAANPVGANVGDMVTVESEDGKMAVISLFVFILPLFVAAGAYAAAFFALSAWTAWPESAVQLSSVGAAFACIAAFFGIAKLSFDRLAKRRTLVTITEIIESKESEV